MATAKRCGSGFKKVQDRIKQKRTSYQRYNFSEEQNALLRTFFDLAQEFDSLKDFYQVCIAALKEFIGVKSRLYLVDETGQNLELVCDSQVGLIRKSTSAPSYIRLSSRPYEVDESYVVPVNRKPSTDDEQPAKSSTNLLMGMLEVYPSDKLAKADRFFIRKYTNRIGYNLHNRLIAEQNIRHLKFINNLVMDIEHNVITPNLYFKHLFNKLKKRVKDFDELELRILSIKESQGAPDEKTCEVVMSMISTLHKNLAMNHKELMEHYANYSLFLESLFRRDHFKEGHLVLRPKLCLVEKEIIEPQLEHYSGRLAARGIVVESPADLRGAEIALRVDVGLLSQVYANLFSNAVKYTTEIVNYQGKSRKAMAYGRDILPDYFGGGKDGIKFNVFTTGPHLTAAERRTIFTDGIRGERGRNLPGTGHGLSFIKQVIEIHGGEVGYEPTEEGNNFYFILPASESEIS